MPPKRSKNQLRREKAKLRKLGTTSDVVSDNKDTTIKSDTTNIRDGKSDDEKTIEKEGCPAKASSEKTPKVLNQIVTEDASGETPMKNDNTSGENATTQGAKQEASQDDVQRSPAKDNDELSGVTKEVLSNEKQISNDDNTDTQEKIPKETSEGVKDVLEGDEQAHIPDSLMEEYSSILKKFNPESKGQDNMEVVNQLPPSSDSSSSEDSENEADSDKPLSRRQQRLKSKISIADLKSTSEKPEAVAWYDADAPDPYLVVQLKTRVNAVDVPGHWLQKKEYLSMRRGVERPPFKLPKFIEDTGIAEMRNYDPESLKKSQRERVQPKMGKLDIDYQKLHDAFFKHQTRPRLLGFGELYYEGREKTDQYKEKVEKVCPGIISKRLRTAIGLPEDDVTIVPPWVKLMSLIGKPPAYATCIIPGVDEPYANTGYRLQDSQNSDLSSFKAPAWGSMEEGEESAEELDEEEEEDEKDANGGTGNPDEDESEDNRGKEDEEEPEKVELSEYTKFDTSNTTKAPLAQGSLYTVLTEKKVSDHGKLGEGAAYDLGGDKDVKAGLKDKTSEDDDVDPTTFKF